MKNLSTDDINQAEHVQNLANQGYMEKIMELNYKLDMVLTNGPILCLTLKEVKLNFFPETKAV
ncbi:hypothetical protein R6Q57_015567 [Mikania cordata]